MKTSRFFTESSLNSLSGPGCRRHGDSGVGGMETRVSAHQDRGGELFICRVLGKFMPCFGF